MYLHMYIYNRKIERDRERGLLINGFGDGGNRARPDPPSYEAEPDVHEDQVQRVDDGDVLQHDVDADELAT